VEIKKRLEFLATFCREAEFVAITEPIIECRDPNDDMFLEVAVNGKASHIVTGDADLLIMNPFRGVAMVNPNDFIADLVNGKTKGTKGK
jgi:predicted nucleic acid-binding protein